MNFDPTRPLDLSDKVFIIISRNDYNNRTIIGPDTSRLHRVYDNA